MMHEIQFLIFQLNSSRIVCDSRGNDYLECNVIISPTINIALGTLLVPKPTIDHIMIFNNQPFFYKLITIIIHCNGR